MSDKEPKAAQMDRFQRFLFLRSMPGLAAVPPEVSQVIAANTRVRAFLKGEYLYRTGVPALEIQYVVSGECEIIRNGRAVRRLGTRSVVGGVSALAGEELGYDCIALEDMVTLAIAVEEQAVLQILQQIHGLVHGFEGNHVSMSCTDSVCYMCDPAHNAEKFRENGHTFVRAVLFLGKCSLAHPTHVEAATARTAVAH